MVTFSLLVTSRPSPPVPGPWSLKVRIVRSGPWPRTVTPLTSSESVARQSNRPAPSSMTSPGLGVDQGRLDPLRGALAGLDPGRGRPPCAGRIPPVDVPCPAGCSAQPATNTAAQPRAAAAMSTTRTSGLPAEVQNPPAPRTIPG